MRRYGPFAYPFAALLLLAAAGCVEMQAGTVPAPDVVVIDEFEAPEGVVRLDPGRSFSLRRGEAPSASASQRAEGVGRSAGYQVAEFVVQQLNAMGINAVHGPAGAVQSGQRRLVVNGTFSKVDQGVRNRRRGGSTRPSEIGADADVTYEAPGAAPQRLLTFSANSRDAATGGGVQSVRAGGMELDEQSERLAQQITERVAALARRQRVGASPR